MSSNRKQAKLEPISAAYNSVNLTGPGSYSASLNSPAVPSKRSLPPLAGGSNTYNLPAGGGSELSSIKRPKVTTLRQTMMSVPSNAYTVLEGPIESDFDGELRTGNDVIEYYARYGHGAMIKVFFCNRVSVESPFELLVVPRGLRNKEHFTITANGVIHERGDGQSEPEFTSIGEWLREQSIFNLMRHMRFFKYYRLTKVFRIWRSTSLHSRFVKTKAAVHDKLLLAKDVFCPTIMNIRGVIYDIMRCPLLTMEDRVYDVDEFIRTQADHRLNKASSQIEMFIGRINSMLDKTIAEVRRSEGRLREAIQEAAKDPSNGAMKGLSSAKVKVERMERDQQYRSVQRSMSQLPNLVRLADYMTVMSMVQLLTEFTDSVRAMFEAKPLFTVHVAFKEDHEGYVLTPDMDRMLERVDEQLFSASAELIKTTPRVLHAHTFRELFEFEGRKPVGPDINSVIMTYKPLAMALAKADTLIDSSYQEATKVSAVFDDLKVISKFSGTWNEEEYKSQERDIHQFRKDMLLMRTWSNDITNMVKTSKCGMIELDATAMQAGLQELVEGSLDVMRHMLITAARAECSKVFTAFQLTTKNIARRPADLDGFCNFLEEYDKMDATREQMLAEASLVDEMYAMLTSYNAKIPEQDRLGLDDLRELLGQFNKEAQESKTFLDETKDDMAESLEKGVAAALAEAHTLTEEIRQGGFDHVSNDVSATVAHVEDLHTRFSALSERTQRYAHHQTLMGMEATDFSVVASTGRELMWHRNKWVLLHEFENTTGGWLNGAVSDLEPEAVQAKVDEFQKNSYKMTKMRKDDPIVNRIKEKIEQFHEIMPLLAEVANKALMPRHWAQIFNVIGQKYEDGVTEFSLQNLLEYNILNSMEQVQAIAATASKEFSMLKTLEKMEHEWNGLEFRCIPYKDTGTFVIGGTDEIQTILDDQIVKIQAMNGSPFVKPFKQRSTEWEQTLQTLQDMLDNWLQCQSTWLYLEPIFSSDDIVKQMPAEGEKFRKVDTMWRSMMAATHAAPAVIPIARDVERLPKLVEANELLDAIQKGLAAYLEKKRLFFPRFFFLSNDEMLEILSETKDPTRVQPHLKKCFEGINLLEFTDDLKVTHMISVEGERVPMKTIVDTVKARGAVEKWLLDTENAMFEAVHNETGKGIEAYAQKPRHEWVLEWPGMVVLVVTAIYWTRGTTQALVDKKVKEYEESCTADLMRIVDLVRGELTKLQRATLGALVVMDVHARDVVTNMVEEGIFDENDFSWVSQLRTYWEADESGERDMTVIMRMMSSMVEYGFEYLGNSSRLVITPLTDRCYRTLMGAIHMNLGGAPEGPAGTGKTETTKDLAKALARQCVVFNCSDSLDYIAMGKFFKGLASSGAWACFDEFNRIDLEVLSVVAQQVLDIQRAIGARLRRFTFEGTEMQLKWSAWPAITMNPGYAGRSELPDNLKALFRTVAMMVPDYAMISEIILFSYGYLKARESAKKIVQCYKLCSEQLSSQDHYDYGMRAVIAVLRAAGNLKRRYPSEDEYVLMLRSIIDVNLCKFLSHDVPLFNGIISDLFPSVVLPKADYKEMEAAMTDACLEMNLQPTPYFFLKTIQLYEMIVVRHGLMIVGSPFSGKTMSYRVLARALTLMNERGQDNQEKAEYHIINPKSITMGQLYGQFDPVSHEWTDGILAVKFRQCASDPSPNRKWLVLDGPVDAIWIENMNTVLDDNKKLCLNSGEIIQMSSAMNMIFEVMDLAVASPATVSRCGMVYLEPHQLGWRPLTLSWINALPAHYSSEIRDHLLGFFDWLVPECLRFLRREIKEGSPTMDAQLVMMLMRIITSMSDHLSDEANFKTLDQNTVLKHLERIFCFAFIWSIGTTAGTSEGRAVFSDFIMRVIKGDLEGYKGPSGETYEFPAEHVQPVGGKLIPEKDGTEIHDWYFDKETGEWCPWSNLMDTSPIPTSMQLRKIIVPTVDTVRYSYVLDLAVKHAQPILFVGPTGTGKSVYVQQYLNRLSQDEYVPPILVGFSARTTANMTQYMIDAKLDRRRKGVFGPPAGKRAVVFVDDLNMPAKEQYGAQPPIELLRQFMDHQGWYDRANTYRLMVDTQFICAMGPPGGGRTFITPRYIRHFNQVSIVEFEHKTLLKIFSTLLDWHFAKESFPEMICGLRPQLVDATLQVYKTVMTSLLPTPMKSHYLFNLRDIARVVQGVCTASANVFSAGAEGKVKFIRLWTHEILRVFYDRMTDDKDREWLIGYLRTVMKKDFDVEFDKLFKHLKAPDAPNDAQIGIEEVRKCFFGDYSDESATEVNQRRYDEVIDYQKIILKMEEFLGDHNAMSKRPMNLAMFLYACEHISRICRVLRTPGAHMMNVGVGGSGRQSLSKLAAYIMGQDCFQIEISKSYTMVEWREDIKRFTRKAGGEGVPCVFLFSDTQIKDERMVEDIGNLLNAGEVPSLFPYDERAAVMEQCRVQSKKEGLVLETPAELWNYFIDKTKENLHIVLCFSPIGDAFRERLRQFPSLVNCCTINWYTNWPNDALEAVAMKFLGTIDLTDQQRKDIMFMCKTFHQDVRNLSEDFYRKTGRRNYVTPTSYLELLTTFQSLLGVKRDEVSKAKKRYEVGLEKLAFTADQVAVMQKELTDLKPVLIKTVAETEELMEKVKKEKTEVVEPKKKIVDEEVKKAQVSADAANKIKTECEEALAEALPILESALAALDTIKPADIKLVQSFKNPPAAIKTVLEAVCVLLDIKPARINDPNTGKKIEDFWAPSQKLLSDSNFIGLLKSYDKDNINPKIIETIRKEYTSRPDFTPANAAKASSAAEGLCRWVFAMDQYDKVAKVVAPKRLALAAAEAEYHEVKTALDLKQAELKEVMDKLALLEAQLDESMKNKIRLEFEVDLCTKKLERAEKLINGLGGERTRWTEAAKTLGLKYNNLTGDMLISAGVVGYLGAFTMSYRDRVVHGWVQLCSRRGIPSSAKFSLMDVLGDPVKIRTALLAGLPNDSFSVDNGIMVANARRWPLMIDPQNQANKWIKNMEKDNDLRVIKLTDGDYLRTLENAIQFGLPVLLENIGEELDPSLEPLLLKQIFKQGGVNYIRLGDASIEFSDQFRFYITTALRNPHYLPETAVKVCLLNFSITGDGLSDQLLAVVVAEERPDLEEQRQQLVVESANNKKKLKEIEDKILSVLSSSQGNILEDEQAIQILSEAKIVSNEISAAQAIADETQKEIDEARKGYTPCGAYNSVLFFCIADMAGIDPMYQYSLAWFIRLFVRSIRQSEKTDDVSVRLQNINNHFTYSLYQNICRSLFEKDKLLFAFLLNARIMLSQKQLEASEYNFLLTGGVGIEPLDMPKPFADWISAKAWGELCRLAVAIPVCADVPRMIAENSAEWQKLYDSMEPETVPLPGDLESKLSPFQRVLVIRCLRPDKVVPAIQRFVAASLGQKFTEPPPFDLSGSFKESSAISPLLFVLSPGSDPTAALLKFAEDQGYGTKISVISMGQGQGPKAAKMIQEAVKQGLWVLLQNCHLAASWMPSLEKIVEGIKPETVDPDFRLWMTSMPSPAFPVSILQNGVKMTMEPPAGVRANLKRSLALDPVSNHEFFEGCKQPAAFKRLLFGLCFVHAFVQERRKFGPIGWNIPYGFDDGDLRISVRQLRMYLDDHAATGTVPFKALKYTIGECNYGGRVTDDKDRRLLNTILDRVYRPDALVGERFNLSASGMYYVPPEGDAASYMNYVNSLPIFAQPEVFGLHENADITKDLQETGNMLETLLLTGGSGSGGDGVGSQEEVVHVMVRDIMKGLPANFDIEKAQHKYPVLYEESMNQVLCQEMLRFNRLLDIIRTSLINLDKALEGLQVMSQELEGVFRAMAVGQVPALWKGKSFPSLKPLASYVEDLLARLKMLNDWYEHQQPPVFWISGFFFTPSFTTAALQNYARKHKLPIDTVGFDFEMLSTDPSEYTTPPEDGVYIHGLFLDGCAWDKDNKVLCESSPKVLFYNAPVIWLRPKIISDFSSYKCYDCPVYRTAERRGVLATTGHSTNFLMQIRMPIAESMESDHYILRGTCMLASLSD